MEGNNAGRKSVFEADNPMVKKDNAVVDQPTGTEASKDRFYLSINHSIYYLSIS